MLVSNINVNESQVIKKPSALLKKKRKTKQNRRIGYATSALLKKKGKTKQTRKIGYATQSGPSESSFLKWVSPNSEKFLIQESKESYFSKKKYTSDKGLLKGLSDFLHSNKIII